MSDDVGAAVCVTCNGSGADPDPDRKTLDAALCSGSIPVPCPDCGGSGRTVPDAADDDDGAHTPRARAPDALARTDRPAFVEDGGAGAIVLTDGERAVEAYLRAQLSPRSKQNARDALRRLARLLFGSDAVLAQIPWTAIGYEQATTIRSTLYEQTRSGAITPGTANLTLSHVRGLLRAMHGMGLITSDQLALTHSGALKNVPGSRVPRGRALTPAEERRLRTAAKALMLDGYQGAMLDTAIVLAIGAGLRREEVARLTLDGVGPAELNVLGKGNKQRQIPVDAQMRDAVDAWLEERAALAPSHGGLFCSPQRPDWVLSPWSFWNLVRGISHTAFGDRTPCDRGCRCLAVVTGPHDFRRTFATRLLEQGLDIRQVQVLMGHESPETTARYDKRSLQALFEKRRGMRVIT